MIHRIRKINVLWELQGLLVWQDFPAGDGRALPLWDAARGVLEQPHGGTAGDEAECRVSTFHSFGVNTGAHPPWKRIDKR